MHGSRTFTAGGELHPAPKINIYLFYAWNIRIICYSRKFVNMQNAVFYPKPKGLINWCKFFHAYLLLFKHGNIFVLIIAFKAGRICSVLHNINHGAAAVCTVF